MKAGVEMEEGRTALLHLVTQKEKLEGTAKA